jgi:hypothetical protein
MRAGLKSVVAVCFAASVLPVAESAIEPVPESEQAARGLRIIKDYQGQRPAGPAKKLHVVYFTPADREPAADYAHRLEAILEDIRGFYRDGMERLGFGPLTFTLARDAGGKLIIHSVRGKDEEADFPGWKGRNNGNTGAPEGGDMVKRSCDPVLKKAGLSFDHETLVIFCQLATYDEAAGTFRHHSPYFGLSTQQSGLCFAADWAQQNIENLTRKEPRLNDGEYGDMSLGKHTTIFLGGIAHELGHAFALPHCGERWDERALGVSIMGRGNHMYREEKRGEGKGSFLTMASAMRLAARPLFSGSDKGEAIVPELERCRLSLSTNATRADLAGRSGFLRVEGEASGSPPVYGVIAYFDANNGGHSPYLAPTATTVPDEQGRFAVEVSDLEPCKAGEVRVEFCHANGAISERRLDFSVGPDHQVDLTLWKTREALEPVASAVASHETEAAHKALTNLEHGTAPELARIIGRKLAGTLDEKSRMSPAGIPGSVTTFALGDARAEHAEVGWLEPSANRVPTNAEVPSPLLDSGGLYATGLYAHSPSRYVFDLGRKWTRLRGEAGLHTHHQNRAFGVVFVIKADGKEVFRSQSVRDARRPHYDVEVRGVKTLELLVEKATERNGGNWGLWLEPTLFRDAEAGANRQEAKKS